MDTTERVNYYMARLLCAPDNAGRSYDHSLELFLFKFEDKKKKTNTVLRVFNGKETFIKYFILSRISGKHTHQGHSV